MVLGSFLEPSTGFPFFPCNVLREKNLPPTKTITIELPGTLNSGGCVYCILGRRFGSEHPDLESCLYDLGYLTPLQQVV